MHSVREPVVVTGAAGFVGVNLVRHLLAAGHEVRTVDRRPMVGVRADGVAHTLADVREGDALRKVFDGAAIVYHLAAKITLASVDPEAWDVNVRGPSVVATTALEIGVPRLVHCSSVHAFDVYRACPRLDETSGRSVSPDLPVYDRSKAAGEAEVRAVIEDGLDAVVVNPTGIIGPVDFGPSRINDIIDKALRGRLPVVVRGGFNWVDVRDVVAGLVAAGERGRTGENYLLAGHRSSIMHLARLAAALNGRRGPLAALPGGLARRVAPLGERIGRRFDSEVFTPASVGVLLADPDVDGSKAVGELGYRARPLEDSVRDTVRWFAGAPRL